MRRTDLMDTSEAAHRELVRRLRAKTPEWRLNRVFELNDLSRQLRKATVHFRPEKRK